MISHRESLSKSIYAEGVNAGRRRSALAGLPLGEPSNLGINLAALVCGAFIGMIGLFLSPLLGLVLVIGVCGLMVLLAYPFLVCYLLIGAIVLTSGMERGAVVPMLKPNELALLASVGITLLFLLTNRKGQQRGSSYFLFSFVILGIGTLFVPWATYNLRGIYLTTNDLFSLVAPLQYFLLFGIFSSLPRNREDRYHLVVLMVVAGSIVAFIGLLQAADLSIVQYVLDRYYPSSHGSAAEEAGRVTSLLGAWNATGIFLMAISLLGWGILPAAQSSRDRLLLLGAIGLSVLGLIATGSFAGMGTLAVGFVLLSVMQGRAAQAIPVLMVTAILVGLLFLVLQPIIGPLIEQRFDYQFSGRGGQDGWIPRTLLFRFEVWREIFWPAIRENPIWGTHPTIPEGFGWHAYESQYIYLLFATGLVGFSSWLLWWVGSCTWLIRQFGRVTAIDRSIGTTTFALFIAMSIAGLTNAVFTFAGSIDYLWILLALTAAGGAEAEL